jgi:hypothetical protein
MKKLVSIQEEMTDKLKSDIWLNVVQELRARVADKFSDYSEWFTSDDNIWDQIQNKIEIGIVEPIDDVLRTTNIS